MYSSLAIFLCVSMFIVGFITNKIKINPYTVFFGLWSIIIFLSRQNLYDLIKTSDNTYKIIFYGCLLFAVGLSIGKIINKVYINKPKNNSAKEKVLNYKLLYFISIICIIVYLIDFSKVFMYIVNGIKLSYIRQIAQQGLNYNSSILNMFRILIVIPFTYLLAIITPVDIFYGNKNKKLIVLTCINIILKMLTDGARSCLIWMTFSLVICYSLKLKSNKESRNKVKKESKKLKNKFLLIFIVLGVLLYYSTLSRSGNDTNRFTYYYFAMEPIMFEKWMAVADKTNIVGSGFASFNGFFFSLFYIIKNTIGFNYPQAWRNVYDLLESVGTNWQIITYGGARANSYASIFLTFYIDGKNLGVYVGMLLYGLFITHFYNKLCKKENQYNISQYIFIILGLFYSFIQFPFKSIYNFITFVMLLTITFRSKEVQKNV